MYEFQIKKQTFDDFNKHILKKISKAVLVYMYNF